MEELDEEKLKDLVDKAKEHDPEAFGKLYDLFVDKIYRYIFYRVGRAVDAEDLTEDVFMKALEAISRYEWREAPFSAWLFRIARNSVTDHFRRQARKLEVVLREEAVEMSESQEAVEQYAAKMMQEQVRSAITQLTADQQNVIILKFYADLNNKEIASFLSKTEGSVKALQHRALQALNRILERGSLK
jgi:RNA polymerase sigma-70 factor (ECF subfamily)